MLKVKIYAIAVMVAICSLLVSCNGNSHDYITIISENQDDYQIKSI